MLRRELQQHTYLGGTAHGDTKYARRQKSAVKKNKQRSAKKERMSGKNKIGKNKKN